MILFHTSEFVIFFILFFASYWIAPKRYKNAILLFASYIFYASWNWKFLSLILISTLVDYFCGLKIHNAIEKRIKENFLILSIIVNLGLLGFFKYFNFFIESFITLMNGLGLTWNFSALSIILPVGISFYTFQTLSYTIDIYRGKMKPRRNIIDFALFVAFFPQLIAGPIERARNLLPKLEAAKSFKKINFKEGFYLFIFGLFKKVVIADYVAITVNKIFSLPDPSGAQVVFGAYAFALLIYADFSGYANMARGISCFFGIKLSVNFRLPYFAKNPSDFWKRWHITLSQWVRDYIYIPLGGSKKKLYGFMPLFITMSLMGLWHGASLNFVLWGIYWFVVTIIYRIIKNNFNFKLKHSWSRYALSFFSVLLMLQITVYSWIIFRLNSLSEIFVFTKALFLSMNFSEVFNITYIQIYLLFLFMIVYEIYQYKFKDQLIIYKQGFIPQLVFYLILFFLYINTDAVKDQAYIYFQF